MRVTSYWVRVGRVEGWVRGGVGMTAARYLEPGLHDRESTGRTAAGSLGTLGRSVSKRRPSDSVRWIAPSCALLASTRSFDVQRSEVTGEVCSVERWIGSSLRPGSQKATSVAALTSIAECAGCHKSAALAPKLAPENERMLAHWPIKRPRITVESVGAGDSPIRD